MATPDIEHVVVLMLENRSFDSMLGWLYQTGAPTQFLPAGSTPTFDGLQSINLNDFTNVAPVPGVISPPVQGAQGFTVPTTDPGEEFEHVTQQFFNSATYPPTAPANMLGYLQDYVNVLTALGTDSGDLTTLAPQVMQTYTAQQLPVLNQLAQAYAVSDAWYASVPSQTNPNRAFLLCGTSNGLTNNGQLETSAQAQEIEELLGMAIGDDRFNGPTIFNAVAGGGKSWSVFWQTSYLPEKISTLLEYGTDFAAVLTLVAPVIGTVIDVALAALSPYTSYMQTLTNGELESCYTWRLFPQVQGLPNAAANFRSMDDFFAMAEAGALPAFSFIEPYWTISQVTTPAESLAQLPKALITALGNDYHPPSNLLMGEAFVKAVYTAVTSNQAAWEKTVLLITFDEFVGTFDHQTEGLQEGLVQPPWGTGTPPPLATQNNFNFDRLGARVPAIVISPWVQAGTVFRSPTATPFDHTSAIATTLKLLGLAGQTATFGARTAAAPTFDTVLTLTTPRTDAASLPFMDKVQTAGNPVNYGDSFLLQDQGGAYLTAFTADVKAAIPGLPTGAMGMCVDVGLAALFPTLAQGASAPMSFVTAAPGVSGQVPDQAQVLLISRETGLGAANALGAWSDSHDCYYFTPYFSAPYDANQTWTVQNHSRPGMPIAFGDQVILTNVSFQQGLTPDTRWFLGSWISTSSSPDYWTVQPAPS